MEPSTDNVPAAEVEIDEHLVRRLVDLQFPQWARLPVTLVESAGWDNTIYRLGTKLAVRIPRRHIGAEHIANESQWLPVLGSQLPLTTPTPVGLGSPAEGYPWPWVVTPWLPGEIAAVAPVTDLRQTAILLAEFVAALRTINPAGGPASELRGMPLAAKDQTARAAIDTLQDEFDSVALTTAWEAARAAPTWRSPAVWMHGDLHPGNILVENGHVTAVIDFGLVAVGDPACDLTVAWTFLSGDARAAFRRALLVDDAAWARARGLALDFGLMCASRTSANSIVGDIGRHTLTEVLTDRSRQR